MADQVLDATIRLNLQVAHLEAQLRKLESRASRPINKKINFGSDGRPLGTITSNFSEFDKSLDAATARVIAFTGTTGIIYGVGAAFRKVAKDFITVESSLAKIQAITKSSGAEMKELSARAFELGNNLGVSFSDVATGLQEFARQGLNAEKALKATAGALVISKLSGTDLKQSIDGLVATTNSFTSELLDYADVANSLVSIDAKFATSAGGLIEGIKRVGAVASDAGVSFQELAATIAAVRQISGRSESIIGNGLKTIFTNLQTERVQKELESLGISTKDAAGNFKPLIGVLQELSTVYNSLSDSKRADLGQKIAGKYQINQFKSLVKGFQGGSSSEFSRGVDAAENSADEVQARLDLLNKTTEASFVRLGNNVTKFSAQFGEKAIKPFIDQLTGLANEFVGILSKVFSDDSGFGKVVSEGIAGVLSGPALALAAAAIGRLAARIGKEFGQAIASVAGLSKQTDKVVSANQAVLSVLGQQNAAREKAIALTERLSASTKPRSLGGRYDPFETNFYGNHTGRTVHPSVYARNSIQNAYPTPPGTYIASDRARNNVASVIRRDQEVREQTRAIALARETARQEQKKIAADAAKAERNRALSTKALTSSFLLPFVGSAAANAFLGGRKTKSGRLTEDITNSAATGLAATALIGGPLGAGVGLALGGAGIANAVNKEKYNPKDQVDKFEKLQSEFTARQNTIQAYVESLNSLGDLKSSGASLNKIQKARQQSDKLLAVLSGTDAEALSQLAGNAEAISNYLGDLSQTEGRRISLVALSKGVAETSSEYNDSFFTDKQKIKSSDLELFAKALVGAIDTTNISSSRLRNLGNKSGEISQSDLVSLGLDPKVVREIFSKLSEGFLDGSKDLSNSVKSLLLSSSRFKELSKASAELEKARISVEANVSKLAKAFAQRSDFDNFVKQSTFQKNISSTKNNLEFESSQGLITEEVKSQVEFETSLLELQNKFNQDTRSVLEGLSKSVQESASRISSDADRAKALKLLPLASSGQLSPLDLANKFEEIANSFKETSDSGKISQDFKESINDIVISGEKLRIEFENQKDVIREAYELEKRRISNAKLSSYNGGQLGPKEFLELLNKTRGTSSVPFGASSQEKANAAQANIDRIRAKRELGIGFSGFADSDLTENERRLKRQEDAADRASLEQSYRDKFGERDRTTNETLARDEIKRINQAVPGAISKETQKEILDAINTSDPAKALKALDKVTRRGLAETETIKRRDGSTRTFSLEDDRTKRIREAASGLSGQLDAATVARGLEQRRAELAAQRDVPSGEVSEEVKRAQDAAKAASRNDEVSIFVDALSKSSHIQKLSSLDTTVTTILGRLETSQNVSSLTKDISEGKLNQSNLQKQIDEIKPKSELRFKDTGGAIVDPLLEGLTGDNYTKTSRRAFDTSSGEISEREGNIRIANLKNKLRDVNFNRLDDTGDAEAAQKAKEESKLSDAEGRLATAVEKLIELEKKRQAQEEEINKKESELKKTTSDSKVSVAVEVSASDILTKVVDGGGFAAQIAKLVNDQFIKVYTETTGQRPVLKPETASV